MRITPRSELTCLRGALAGRDAVLTVRRWRWEEPARRPWRRGQGAPEPPCRAEPGACHAGARGGGGTEATSCPARTNARYLPSDPASIASVAVSLTAQTNHHKRAGRRTKTENRDQTPQQTGDRKADENSRLLSYRPATAAQCNSWPKSPHLRRATLDSWRGGCLYLFVPFPSSIPVVACEYPGRASCPYLDYYSPSLVFRFSLLE